MKSNFKIVAAVFGLFLLVVLLVSLTFHSFKQIGTAAEARKHTFKVLNSADDFMSALKDAETGQRGFLLTGDEAFLLQYTTVRDGVTQQLQELRAQTSNSAARKHLDTIVPLVAAKFTEMAHVVNLRRPQ